MVANDLHHFRIHRTVSGEDDRLRTALLNDIWDALAFQIALEN